VSWYLTILGLLLLSPSSSRVPGGDRLCLTHPFVINEVPRPGQWLWVLLGWLCFGVCPNPVRVTRNVIACLKHLLFGWAKWLFSVLCGLCIETGSRTHATKYFHNVTDSLS
jgi:hypothetical protein